MTVQAVVFAISALIVLGGAMAVIWSRNAVHAALGLVATLFGVAVLFLNQNAQLLAAIQVIVYTGAIVILILFVIMLLGVDREEDLEAEPLVGQRALAALLAISVFVVVFGVFLLAGPAAVTGTRNCTDPQAALVDDPFVAQCAPVDPGLAVVGERPNVEQIGEVLFTDFVFAFGITAALLTIAVVGAVAMSRKVRAADLDPVSEPEPIDDPEPTPEIDLDPEAVDQGAGS